MRKIYLVGANRTPIGKFGGSLASFTAADLGTLAAKESIKRANLKPEQIQEVIFGNARQAGVGPNVARQITFRAGIPTSVPAYTINKACGSGLKSIINAYQSIALGDADIILAGGTESMSNVPYLLPNIRWGLPLGKAEMKDAMYQDGFLCPLCNQVMGETAENVAEKYKISRKEQDEFALLSQSRCEKAQKECRFKEEIVPVEIQDKKGNKTLIDKDEHPRSGTTLEGLAKLKPVFKENGTVTAGNSCGITDGAASVIVISEEKVKELKIQPQAEIVAYASAGVEPALMGIGPVPAVKKLLEKQKVSLDEIDLIELNEAFASQVLACQRELNLDPNKLNVNGGAIALGHPIGCTGSRIVVTLIYEMLKQKSGLGLATLCISGGMGMALLLKSS